MRQHLAALSALVLALPCAWAQSAPASAPVSQVYVDAVTIEASPLIPLASKQAGVSVFVVTPDPTRLQLSSAADLLQQVPGVTLRSQGGDGQRQVALLRGTSEEQVLVLVDGIRLNSSSGGGIDLSLLPAAAIEKIEVITGAAAALYGAEALGGVLSITTRTFLQKHSTELRASYGSFGTSRGALVSTFSSGDWSILAVASGLQSQGDFAFVDKNEALRIRQNNTAALGTLWLNAVRPLSSTWKLRLLGRLDGLQRGVPGPEQFESLSAEQKDQNHLLALQLTGQEVAPGLQYSFTASLRSAKFSFVDPDPLLGPPQDSFSQEISPASSGSFQLQRGRHRVFGDISLSHEWMRASSLAQQEHRLRGSMVLGDELRWNDFFVSTALRLEGSNELGLVPIPRLGLRWKPTEALSIQAALGRSYRLPSTRDLFVKLDGISGNPDLLPEDATELSAGLSWKSPMLSLSLQGFRRNINNMILFSPVSALSVRASNFSGYQAQGLEASSSLVSGPLSFDATLSFLKTEAPQGDVVLVLPGLPTWRGTACLSWKRQDLSLFSAFDSQSSFFLNRQNTQTAAARFFWDMGAAFAFRPSLSASIEVRNLLDNQRAIDALQIPLPSRALTIGIFSTW